MKKSQNSLVNKLLRKSVKSLVREVFYLQWILRLSMVSTNKGFSLLLVVVLVASSLIMVEAQITKPSVPEFSLKLVDASYDIPTTQTIDPYTGQNTILVITIQNQPLVYQFTGNEKFGSESFYYNIQIKGHYAENWTQLYLNDELPMPNASSTQTSLTLGVLGESGLNINLKSITVPFGGKEDFRVQAMMGYFHKMAIPLSGWFFEGETSGWSNTQAITIPATSTSPSPNPTPTPTVPEFSLLAILPLLFSMLFIAVILRHRKTVNLIRK
jgi:hypothetical protein